MKYAVLVPLTALGLLSACQKDEMLTGRAPKPSANSAAPGAQKAKSEGAFTAPKESDKHAMAPIKSALVHAVIGDEQPVTMTLTCLDDVLAGIKLFRVGAIRMAVESQVLVKQNPTEPVPGKEAEQPSAFANFNCKPNAKPAAKAATTELPKNVKATELKLGQQVLLEAYFEADQKESTPVIVACADREKFDEADKLFTAEAKDKKAADLVIATGSKVLMMVKAETAKATQYVLMKCGK